MALDRRSIAKKDFPVGPQGYDPDAVDEHLARLADELEEFKRSSSRRHDPLASAAATQVRAIVEAAEHSAAEIQREAESEAREIRDEANTEAQATREQASEQAREHVSKVSESTAAMLQRIDALESELSALIDALRTGGKRLEADLRLLEANLTDITEAVTPPRGEFEPEEPEPAAPAPPTGGWGAAIDEPVGDADDYYDPDEAGQGPVEPVTDNGHAYAERPAAPAPAAPAAGSSDGSDDAEGARLIALNMALNGTPRTEAARYLSENFQLDDSEGLLDEVYASVEG